MGITLAEMHREEEDRICCNHLQQIGMAPGQGIGPTTHLKVYNPAMLLSKGRTGTKKMEQRLKEGPTGDHPTWGSIMSADMKPNIVTVVKRHFLTGT